MMTAALEISVAVFVVAARGFRKGSVAAGSCL